MRMILLGLVVILVLVTLFTLSNTMTVPVMFLQYTLYKGQLALVLVGAGVLGALLAYLPSLIRQAHLTGRIRELERALSAQETSQAVVAEVPESVDESGSLDESGSVDDPGRVDDTRPQS